MDPQSWNKKSSNDVAHLYSYSVHDIFANKLQALKTEFCHKLATSRENLSSGFPIRSDTNRAVQAPKMARDLNRKKRCCTIYITQCRKFSTT